MKILFITDLYPIKEEEKTTPRTLLNFTNEWIKQGHEVDVIKPNFLFNSFLRGKPFYKPGQYGNVLNINFLTPFWGNIKKYSPIKNGEKHSSDMLVIAHMPSGILFADKLGLPFVAGIHNSDLEVLTNPLYIFHFRKRLKRALNNAKAIACRSYVIQEKLLKLFPEFKEKTFVAPSGIDEKIIVNPSTLQYRQNLKVLTCANFIKRKNIDKVIKACKNKYKLTVIGDGKLEKKLKKLDKNVTFTGRLNSEQVYQEMRNSDIFVLPSINETFGMVYLEAMSQGCITVCTKNDGIDGIIKNGQNGFLCEPDENSIKMILDKISSLTQEELQLLRHNSIETVKNLSAEQCAANYLQQILKIL